MYQRQIFLAPQRLPFPHRVLHDGLAKLESGIYGVALLKNLVVKQRRNSRQTQSRVTKRTKVMFVGIHNVASERNALNSHPENTPAIPRL